MRFTGAGSTAVKLLPGGRITFIEIRLGSQPNRLLPERLLPPLDVSSYPGDTLVPIQGEMREVRRAS